MKTIAKAIIAAGLVILVIVAFPVGQFIFEIVSFDYGMEKQMKAGQKYMDSLTDKDIQVWIQRTQKYLKDDPTTNTAEWLDEPVPPELVQLKIVGINVLPDEVDYVWVGGMDHTILYVERMANGSFQLTAEYNNYSNRVIWPKQ
jgi:hypothetical protein